MPGRRSGRHGRRQQARGDARGFVLSARGGRLQWHCLKRRNIVSARSSGDDPCCPTAADALDASENGCRSARSADCAVVPGFPKNRERGNRQLLHSMWLLKPAAGRSGHGPSSASARRPGARIRGSGSGRRTRSRACLPGCRPRRSGYPAGGGSMIRSRVKCWCSSKSAAI